ncbi:efflux RND transporter periplasmic adaptor subunit [Thalassotalea sp. SU-HH00458]|uniref:efflux RND transporter periplasmic adaptor subunit n=1 Tax=Thalassotalea sp. SU-HH00458 TaxID=3127657 RepID=UPI0031096F57
MSFSLLNKKAWLPIGIIALGGLIAYQILSTSSVTSQKSERKKQKRVRIVQVSALEKGSIAPSWLASGYVKPSETINIHAKVSGDIEQINPLALPGQTLKKGDWLVKLDPVDFELSLNSQHAQLEQANASLALEQADQVLAKEELALLNQNNALNIDQDLVLRKPQLAVAQSKVAVAKNNLAKAKLNLKRTTVVMPFNGQIMTKNVGRGSKVSSNTKLFAITNTQKYWLEVKISHLFLAFLDESVQYKVMNERVWGKGKYRQAQFISILPELDNKDRQIKVLLAIDNPITPLKDNQPHVFINDFVNVELQGKTINNAWTIKHHWLQADNTIWVVDAAQTLQKRKVNVLFKGRNLIYIEGEFQRGDLALAEKPGIANVNLPVKPRRIDIVKGKNRSTEEFGKNKKKTRDLTKRKKNKKVKKGNE